MPTEEQKKRAREEFKKLTPEAQTVIKEFVKLHKGKPASEVFEKEIKVGAELLKTLLDKRKTK